MCETILTKYGFTRTNYRQICAMRPCIRTLSLQRVRRNTETLEKYLPHTEIKRQICRYPKLLEADIEAWTTFLEFYGVSQKDIRNLYLNSYAFLTETNIYDFGMRILNVKSYGFTDEEIRRFYIPLFTKKTA